jgi:hypothetical protein
MHTHTPDTTAQPRTLTAHQCILGERVLVLPASKQRVAVEPPPLSRLEPLLKQHCAPVALLCVQVA